VTRSQSEAAVDFAFTTAMVEEKGYSVLEKLNSLRSALSTVAEECEVGSQCPILHAK
jgi:hypothetical protein